MPGAKHCQVPMRLIQAGARFLFDQLMIENFEMLARSLQVIEALSTDSGTKAPPGDDFGRFGIIFMFSLNCIENFTPFCERKRLRQEDTPWRQKKILHTSRCAAIEPIGNSSRIYIIATPRP